MQIIKFEFMYKTYLYILALSIILNIEVKELSQKDKPKSDLRNYKYFTLENGLKVVLINDTSSTKTILSLSYHVGSYYNPPTVPGLAHFLEHLHFLNSEKYKELNYFHSRVRAMNGTYNAYTAHEFTNFIFEVKAKDEEIGHFEHILDIFTNMFISPIISIQNMEAEVNAVDSEFKMDFSDRTFIKDTVSEYFEEGHPLAIFDCGNKHTLFDKIEDKEYLKDLITLFREVYYQSDKAALVITSPLPEDELLKMVQEKFSALPQFDSTKSILEFENKYDSTKYAQSFVKKEVLEEKYKKVLPLKNTFSAIEGKSLGRSANFIIYHQISITKTLNNKIIEGFLMYLINLPTPGGLVYLYTQVYGVTAHIGVHQNYEDQKIFTVNFILNQGQIYENEFLKSLTQAFYDYIWYILNIETKLLQDKFEYFINLSKLQWNFTEPIRDMMNNSQIANKILEYGFEETLLFNADHVQFDYGLFQAFLLQILQSNSILVYSTGDNQEDTFDKKTPNYFAEYKELCIINEDVEKWCQDSKWKEFLNEFYLMLILRKTDLESMQSLHKFDIMKNKHYTDLNIDDDYFQSKEYSLLPKLLDHKGTEPEGLSIYYLQDGYYGLPKSNLQINMRTNLNLVGQNEHIADIFFDTIGNQLFVHELSLVELGYQILINPGQFSINIIIYGFDKWMTDALEVAVRYMMKEPLDEQIVLHNILSKIEGLKNEFMAKGNEKGPAYFGMLLCKYKNLKVNETINYLTELADKIREDHDMTDLYNYRNQIAENIGKVEFLFVGSIEKKQLYEIVNKFVLEFIQFNPEQVKHQEYVKLKHKNTEIILPNNNPFDNQNVLIFGFQIDYSGDVKKDLVLSTLLVSYLDALIFKDLRTGMQMGYVAYTTMSGHQDAIMIKSLINGDRYSIQAMKDIYADWFQTVMKRDKNVTQEEFDARKRLLSQQHDPMFPNLNAKSMYLFGQILHDEDFDKILEMSRLSQSITHQEYLDFIEYVLNDSKRITMILKPTTKVDNDIDVWSILEVYDEEMQQNGYFEKKKWHRKEELKAQLYHNKQR